MKERANATGAGLSWGPGVRGGREVLDGHPQVVLAGAGGERKSRRVALQTSHFSRGKGVIPHPCFASSCPQSRPRGRRAGRGRTGPRGGRCFSPGGQGVRWGSASVPGSPRAAGRAEAGPAAPEKATQRRLGRYRRVSPPWPLGARLRGKGCAQGRIGASKRGSRTVPHTG